MKNKILRSKIGVLYYCVIGFLFSGSAYADYDIGTPDDGPLTQFTAFIQDIVNFVDGPVALAFSFFSIAGFAVTWAVAPKMMGAMGLALRIVLAVVVILNIGVWITALQSG